ncbi:uncharacterized protein LOC130047095 isoform X5 [Ostrea edulis]|uniref:uncharacterized protein LOC130047095 isoform X5 n=1 Tax=Ostrea edulis TaxID=37623 RepID=UPI0024AF193C|nr:uncharacterized protein LOC130047095 isoform X5 [Ostrea edulis]
MITMDKYKYFRVWILFSSVVIHVHASTVKVEKVYLNWTDSNEACVLLDFLSVKPNFKTLVADMKQNEKYWIKDNVVERSVVTKGCQTKVNVLNSTTIEDNILSKCFQFCSESSDTVGIQENNCSCLSNLNNSFDNVCDDQCVWTNEQCKEIAAFSVYERKDYKSILSGYRFDRCITLFYTQQLFWTKTDCSKKCHYICQKNGDLLVNSQEEVTWLEAVSICARNQSVLANILPETNVKLPRNARYRLSYWVGIRQHYETVSDDKSVCHYIERYNSNDIIYGAETCTKELHYICLNENTTSTSMVKPSASTQQHPVSGTNSQGFNSTSILGAVVGVLVIIAILLLAIVCLFKRFRRRNSGSKYQSPSVVFSNAPRRDSKQSQEKSVKSTPVKPTRRSKKSNSNSIVQGIAYENIVLSFEDPSTISRVISSSSTVKQETKDEDTYDVMGASNTNENTTNVSQNVYGFTSSSDDYDVMDRGITRTEEQNPYYDHM